MARRIAVVVAGSLAAVAALHVVWAFSPWPFADRAGFADAVVGVAEADLPSRPMVFAVATLLAVAAIVVAGRGRVVPPVGPAWVYRWGAWTVAAALLVRGLAGFGNAALAVGGTATYQRLDAAIYSPLCVLLALGAAVAARGTLRR